MTSSVRHSQKRLQTIRVGHTPDMDDAFMFYAIAAGAVNTDGLVFEHVIEDIQALNRRALSAELDMTAVSAAVYPVVAKDYWIVSVGSSVGQGYGPLVLSKQPSSPEQLRGRRIAVPGAHTTAYTLLRLAVPEFQAVEMPFTEIPKAVLEDRVVAVHICDPIPPNVSTRERKEAARADVADVAHEDVPVAGVHTALREPDATARSHVATHVGRKRAGV